MNKTGAVLLVLTAAVLAALYLFARPQAVPPPAPAQSPISPVPLPQAHEFAFEVAAGKITGPPQMRVQQGERVALRLRSDVTDELHVHGYDISAPLPAGEEVVLKFVASKAGRFEAELHGAHVELGALEVYPR